MYSNIPNLVSMLDYDTNSEIISVVIPLLFATEE